MVFVSIKFFSGLFAQSTLALYHLDLLIVPSCYHHHTETDANIVVWNKTLHHQSDKSNATLIHILSGTHHHNASCGTVDPPVGIEVHTRVPYPESLLGDQSRGGQRSRDTATA